MAKIIFSGKTYTTTAPDHISYTSSEYAGEGGVGVCNSWNAQGICIGYAPTYPTYNNTTKKASATITGTITSSVPNVSIQGSKPVTKSSDAKETDTFTLPSGASSSGSGNHTNASATLNGNTKNVYVNGSLVVVSASNVNTHVSGISVALDTTTASTTVNIG